MSIASEISRLQGAKADIKTAIQGKGVTVPSAAKLDDYADYIDDIPQGTMPTGTKQIYVTQNGTQTENVSGFASAQLNVTVPNSYSASDEGKVVSNGALVAQTAHADVTPTTSDQTIDTTTNNSIKVKGDADLIATNIKKDVEIFGVTGSYEGGGASNEDAILSGSISGMYSNHTLTTMRGQALRGCTSITGLCLPNTATIGGEALEDLTSCTIVDLGAVSQLTARVLQNDTSLTTIILRATSRVSMQATNALNNTPFASGKSGGTIYIPKSLYDHLGDGTSDDYKVASNWSAYDGYATITWAKIEGSQYENYYADGTPIT